MNRLEVVAGASLVALVAAGIGQKYNELSKLASTPPPSKNVLPKIQVETRPERTVDAAIGAYLTSVENAQEGDRRTQLGSLLASLESPEFDGEEIDSVTAESLSKAIVSVFDAPGDGGTADLELRRRAVGFLATRVPGRTSRDFVFKALDEGPEEIRLEALKRVGSPLGVRGSAVYAKVVELGAKGLVPDGVYPAVLRRTGGAKAKDGLVALMTSTDSTKLIAGCAIALQDYRDPELIGKILERLEAVGMIDSAGKMPWVSPALLDEHMKSADKASFRRGMIAMSTRPVLVKTGIVHVEKGLQSADSDTRRYAAIAVKKAVVAKLIDAKQGETLLAGRLHALEELLADVPYRQWVLVLPKRLRYFVHRDQRLPGEISRRLAEALTDFYLRRCGAPKDAVPAQFHVLQRFGSSVNLHLHDHAVVSDGVFSLDSGVLRFSAAPPPSTEEVARLVEGLRRRILKRMLRLKVLPEAVVGEMLAWPHGGFSLDGGTYVEASDRAGLERLLLYVLRPALSLKQLTYKPEQDLVRYRPGKGKPDSPAVLEWRAPSSSDESPR